MLLFEPTDINVPSPAPPGLAVRGGVQGGTPPAALPAGPPSCQPTGPRVGAVLAGGGACHGGEALYPDIGPSIIMTGSQAPLDSCGDVVSNVICSGNHDHSRRVVRAHCKSPGCKVCWPTWDTRATTRVVDRMQGYRKAARVGYQPRHITLSPPDWVIPPESIDGMKRIIEQARRVVGVMGMDAAVVVPHGYRIRPERRDEARAGAEASGMNRYRWCMAQDNPRDYLVWSPHVHLLHWGYLKSADAFHEQTGWIYHTHGRLDTREDQERATYYLLSHAWVIAGAHTVRYWGGISSRNLHVREEVYWQEEACPDCGAGRVRVPIAAIESGIINQGDTRPSRVRVSVRFYRLSGKHGPVTGSSIFDYDTDDAPGGLGAGPP